MVDRTGEVVPRHPNTRVIFTDNRPLGDGSETDQYLGRNAQDASVLDRCWHIACNFPKTDEQIELIWKKVSHLATGLDTDRARNIVRQVVQFAEEVRENRDRAYDNVSISNRGILRFVSMLFAFAKAPKKPENPVQLALGLTIANGLSAPAATGLQNALTYDHAAILSLVMKA